MWSSAKDNSHTGIEIVLQSVSVYQIKCPQTMEGLLTQPTANPSAGSTQRAAVEGNKFPDLANNRLCALPKCGKVPEIGAQVVISPTAHKELRKRKWIRYSFSGTKQHSSNEMEEDLET